MAGTVGGPTSPVTLSDVMHLHRRAGFGGLVAGASGWVGHARAEVVASAVPLAPLVTDITPAVLRDPSGSNWEQWVAATQAWIDEMVTSAAPIVEKMALFWHGHFVSGNDKIYDMRAMWAQIDLFRRAGTGSFRALAHAVAVTPAMLFYLDNWQSVAAAPNENFARELLELFLLGTGHYTEDDVVAASRAWTGHTVDAVSRGYVFRPDWHDGGVKTFLGAAAAFDGPDIIDAVFDHPVLRHVCAARIVRKLWLFFASDDPPAAVVDDLVSTFLATDWNVAATLRALFSRDEFYDAAVLHGLARSPVEWCVAVARASGLPAADNHPEWHLPAMGQELFAPPNVAGWGTNRYWISTAAAAARADHAVYAAWKASSFGDVLGQARDLADGPAVDAAFAAFGVDQVSPASHSRATGWLAAQRAVPWTGYLLPQHLLALVALSPEVQLA